MSEQSKSNYQALGAGLLGFVAVMAVGGGGLMLHSSHRAKSAAPPAPAAAPIDLGAAMPAPSMGRSMQKERRAESPAPLIGEIDEGSDADVAASAAAPASSSAEAAAPSPESAPAARAPALEVTRHLDLEKGSSSAEAVVKNTVAAKKAAALPVRKAPEPKLEVPAGDGAVASSVHYGVTSRSELMGRAAGPVYNFKGAKGGAAVQAAGKMADDADGKMADLRRQLEASGLPEDQRAKLLKELDEAMKNAASTTKTAQ